MSAPKGLIVRVKCFALSIFFFSCYFATVVFVFVCFRNEEEECSYHHVPLPARSINRRLSTTSCPPRALFPLSHSEDAGLFMTLAAVWRLLVDDRECLALIEVWLMGSVALSGSLSTRRIAEGHCVCALASSALLLYRNALIDIPEVLINKRTHTFLTLVGFALLLSFFGL